MQSILQPIARYTRFVLFGKHALWVLAGGLTAAIAVVATMNAGDTGSRIIFSGADGKQQAAQPEPASMQRPRYQGVDASNRPFNITADEATQIDANTVDLTNLNADMTLQDKAWVALTAGHGRYRMDTEVLELTSSVNMFYEGGYEFRSDSATLFLQEGRVEGTQPVEGQGPSAILKADRFKVLDRGNILQFNENVKVTLYL